MPIENPQQLQKLLELIREAAQRDNALREKYVVGQKFRFVQDRLQSLLETLEKKLQITVQQEEKARTRVTEDEMLVYVYLYNAQGLILRSWENMLTPKVFYEYSVNRPIYADKAHIQSLLRSKTNKAQHAYLTIAIKRTDIVPVPEGTEQRKDAQGNPLVRVKEGSLHFDHLIQFSHNEQDYEVTAEGEITKKSLS